MRHRQKQSAKIHAGSGRNFHRPRSLSARECAGSRQPITGPPSSHVTRAAASSMMQVATPQPPASRDSTYFARSTRFANETLYTGRRLDPESGLYYYRNRYYGSALGRLGSRDPIDCSGSRWNLYEYAVSNPHRYLDPFGFRHVVIVVLHCHLPKSSQYNYFFDQVLSPNPDQEQSVLPPEGSYRIPNSITDELERIFNECIKRFGDPKKYGVMFSSTSSYEGETLPGGIKLGPDLKPKENPYNGTYSTWAYLVEENNEFKYVGQAVGSTRCQVSSQTIYKESERRSDKLLAAIIGHEFGHHSVCENRGVRHSTPGHIDSSPPASGSTFTDETCRKLLKRFGIPTKR